MKIVLGILLSALGGVLAQDDACPETGMTPFDYAQALCMSPLFYEAQRSGYLPSDQRVSWRHDSCLDDGQDNGVDLEGGYFDAGDYVKFGFPMAFTITGLAWGLVAYPNGYVATGQTDYVRQSVKWGADYILKAHTESMTLYGQVGDAEIDHDYWGRPEDMDLERPSFKIDGNGPGSDLAGECSAALAATSVVFKSVDQAYSEQCMNAAVELYEFANNYRGIYSETIQGADGYYTSSSYEDELPWAALWLYQATGEESYLQDADDMINSFGLLNDAFGMDWDDKTPGIYALMAELDGSNTYTNALESYVDSIMSSKHTPLGLVFISNWGSLAEAMGVSFIALRAASLGINTRTYNDWAQSQVDYALGSTGRSFVCGFGVNPPTHPQHCSSSCPDPPQPCDWDNYDSPDPNTHVLYGALVGGPNRNDEYVDDRSDYVHNEVACDYNALFTGCLAAMVELH